MERKSYNLGAEMVRQGLVPADSDWNMDDRDLVDHLGLDPELAYTPNINKEAALIQRQRNIQNGIANGLPKGKAIKEADRAHKQARQLAASLYK